MNRRYYGIENVCRAAAGVYDLQTIINNIIPVHRRGFPYYTYVQNNV